MARRTRQRYKVTLAITGHPQHPNPYMCVVESLDPHWALYDAEKALGKKLHTIYLPTHGMTVGTPFKMEVTLLVKHLGAVGRKKYTPEERAARATARQVAEAAKEVERKEREAQQRRHILTLRKQIVNQIELAFEKKMKTATHYVTCEHCHDQAAFIFVERQPEGTTVPFDDIVGAKCATHAQWFRQQSQPSVACNRIEFFYDGLRQLHINKAGA